MTTLIRYYERRFFFFSFASNVTKNGRGSKFKGKEKRRKRVKKGRERKTMNRSSPYMSHGVDNAIIVAF